MRNMLNIEESAFMHHANLSINVPWYSGLTLDKRCTVIPPSLQTYCTHRPLYEYQTMGHQRFSAMSPIRDLQMDSNAFEISLEMFRM